MTEQSLPDADLNALSGSTDTEQGIPYPAIYESPYYTSFYRMVHRLLEVARRAGDLRVYKDGDLTFGLRAGTFLDGDSLRTVEARQDQPLTDNATNYIYLTVEGTLVTDTAGFPVPSDTPHLQLAVITTTDGNYAHANIADRRGSALFQPSRGHFPEQLLCINNAVVCVNNSPVYA